MSSNGLNSMNIMDNVSVLGESVATNSTFYV